MKKILTITFFFPALLFAQQKKSFIKEFLYVKISPTLSAVTAETDHLQTGGLAPAIYGAVGAKMRYAAVGFSTGFFKLKHAGQINPVGVDLTITDFKRKFFPVITAQWHKTPFKEYNQGGRYSSLYTEGKDMYSIAVGGAFRTLKTSKIMLTAGVSKLNCKVTMSSIAGGPNQPTSYYHYNKEHYRMLFVAASFVW